MAWDELINQRRVAKALQQALGSGRVAHAYLFYGPDGVGKRAVALAFAQALQCEEGGAVACGRCAACGKVRRMAHPDVRVLLPVPSDVDEHDVGERLQHIAAHPYAAVDFVRRPSLSDATKASSKQAFYSVKLFQETLRRMLSYKPLEGRYQVVILTDADLMRTAFANAFLKVLEEPGSQTVFILTTSRQDRLLPTIVSRCQRLRFDVLSVADIEQALIKKEGMAADKAATLARMADGSYTRALDLAENEDLMRDRDRVIAFLRYSYGQHVDHLAGHIEEISRMGREQVKGLLRLLLSWIRDLMLYRTMAAEAPLVNIDQAAVLARFCANVPQAELEAMVGLVEEAIELVERNVQLVLLLTTLSQRLGHAMHGHTTGPLYQPLAEVYAPQA